jgi:hypothetical protein
MSNKTYRDGAKSSVLVMEPDRRDLEVVLAFDQFLDAKTSDNIASWLTEGHLRGGIKPDMILCHSTDGASNAVGSAKEFKAIVAVTRENHITHYTCMAHQVNRAARYASGSGDFVNNANVELSAVLKKMHEINARVYRSESRLKVLFKVQQERGR